MFKDTWLNEEIASFVLGVYIVLSASAIVFLYGFSDKCGWS